MRRTLMRDILAPAAVVLLLACSGSYACGQGGADGYFNAGGGLRGDEVQTPNGANWGGGLGVTSWGAYGAAGGFNGATWGGLNEAGDPGAEWGNYTEGSLPVGSGLLVLAASGACYAALRCRRRRERAAD